MDSIQYVEEHLWLGKIGHILVVLAFVASIVSLIGYSIFTNKKQEGNADWKLVGRYGYYTHIFSVVGIIGLLFFAMINSYYEYAYVFQHVSDDLPMKYIVSAFWEGQEGSFLLWMSWHLVLGAIIIRKGGFWESPVMTVIALSQAFMASMILGLHLEIGDWATKFGSNPFLLIRDTFDAPIFSNAEYLSLIKGQGLNPLLQNYWMTIHPPVTFLGFASLTMPFAFAVAGLWTRKYKEWLEPALPWCLFAGFILGTGILMGSLWAYEALSFGGYWNWDPVENAVLVPWLTLIAGIHTHLIARATGRSIRPTAFFYIISMVLIVYSTYLTRSGILGDTSAHAFTEMGLEKQLIAYFGGFLLVGLYFLITRYAKVPAVKEEESINSREFWMFIGSLVLLFSGVLISISTSIPVYNAIREYFDPTFIGRVINDPVEHYNKYQVWIAVFIAILSGIAMSLRYNEKRWNNWSPKFIKNVGLALLLSIVATLGISTFWELHTWQYTVLAATAMFTVFANLIYFLSTVKGNLKLGSSALAHFGFGMMIIGLIGSGLNKEIISSSPFFSKGIFANEEDAKKYVRLMKDKKFFAQGYWMTYEGDTMINRLMQYTVDFKYTGTSNGEVIDSFKLYPTGAFSNDMTKIVSFNPDTRHHLHKDLFSVVMGIDSTKSDIQYAREYEESLKYTRYELALGDSLTTPGNNTFYLKDINFAPRHREYSDSLNDLGVEAVIVGKSNVNISEVTKELYPAVGMQGKLVYKYPYIEQDLGIRIRIADDVLEDVFTPDDRLQYEVRTLKSYGTFDVQGTSVTLNGFNPEPEHNNYIKEEGDIAVGAKLTVTHEGKSHNVEPIFILRQNRPLIIKAYVPEAQLHIQFTRIDPEKEEFTFFVAKDSKNPLTKIPIEIAEELPRTDYIILQANIFPGINLFWVGSFLMMLGLLFASIYRRRKKA